MFPVVVRTLLRALKSKLSSLVLKSLGLGQGIILRAVLPLVVEFLLPIVSCDDGCLSNDVGAVGLSSSWLVSFRG